MQVQRDISCTQYPCVIVRAKATTYCFCINTLMSFRIIKLLCDIVNAPVLLRNDCVVNRRIFAVAIWFR